MPKNPALVIAALAVLAAACARKPAHASARVDEGRQLYAKMCVMCHGVDGKGYAADNAPALRNPSFLGTASDAFLRAGIARGRPGTAMAGYGQAVGGPLTPAQVDALIAYLYENQPARTVLLDARVAGDAQHGKAIYDAECTRCHGTADQRVSAVHLANPVLLDTASDTFLRYAVEHGRPGTPMLAFAAKLGARGLDDVVAYVRSLAVQPAVPAPVPPTLAGAEPRVPRTGPIVLNPRGKAAELTLKDDRFVPMEQVKRALDQKRRLVIVDARAPSDWLNLHVKGAISAPYYDPSALDDIPNDGTWVVAYCACPHHASGEVVDQLRKRGYKHTAVLDEGIFAWQRQGYPVVAAPGMLPPPAPPPLPARDP
jgi:mono/diheme cytochrome c family protein/rhodanese-related sulfurtransferase